MAPFGASRAGLMSVVGDDIPDSVVDNFEDRDGDPAGVYGQEDTLSDYYIDVGGQLSDSSRDTTRSISGEKSLNLNNNGEFDWIYSPDGNGLNRYPEKGEIIESYHYNNNDNMRSAMGFGIDDSGEGYWVLWSTGNQFISKGEPFDTIVDVSQSAPSDEWLLYRVEWHDGTGSEADGTIVFELWEADSNGEKDSLINTISTTDDDYGDERGIGWCDNNSSSDESWADDYRVVGHVSD